MAAPAAQGAPWTVPENELVLTATALGEAYQFYARNSTNERLLQEPGGSVVQAGEIRRVGFFLGAEYGLTDRVTANLGAAFLHTQHLVVGENLRQFTSSKPNTQTGFQDLTGSVKFLAWQTEGTLLLGAALALGFAVPLTRYDTSVDNPLGDGIVSVDLGLALGAVIPSLRIFANGDLVYRAREDTAARVGNVWPRDAAAANPSLLENGTIQVGAEIHDQVQATLELGAYVTDRLSVRVVVRRIETLGGENLTFSGMPQMMTLALGPQPMFENSLAYDQDCLYLGGGPYYQINDYLGVGLTYTHAVWFRNFPNIKSLVLSVSVNPQLARRLLEQARQALEAAEAASAAP